MLVLNDYKCTNCGETTEYLLDNATYSTSCHLCGGVAKKVQSAISFKLEGVSGSFPTAADKWASRRPKQIALEQREARLNGEPL